MNHIRSRIALLNKLEGSKAVRETIGIASMRMGRRTGENRSRERGKGRGLRVVERVAVVVQRTW